MRKDFFSNQDSIKMVENYQQHQQQLAQQNQSEQQQLQQQQQQSRLLNQLDGDEKSEQIAFKTTRSSSLPLKIMLNGNSANVSDIESSFRLLNLKKCSFYNQATSKNYESNESKTIKSWSGNTGLIDTFLSNLNRKSNFVLYTKFSLSEHYLNLIDKNNNNRNFCSMNRFSNFINEARFGNNNNNSGNQNGNHTDRDIKYGEAKHDTDHECESEKDVAFSSPASVSSTSSSASSNGDSNEHLNHDNEHDNDLTPTNSEPGLFKLDEGEEETRLDDVDDESSLQTGATMMKILQNNDNNNNYLIETNQNETGDNQQSTWREQEDDLNDDLEQHHRSSSNNEHMFHLEVDDDESDNNSEESYNENEEFTAQSGAESNQKHTNSPDQNHLDQTITIEAAPCDAAQLVASADSASANSGNSTTTDSSGYESLVLTNETTNADYNEQDHTTNVDNTLCESDDSSQQEPQLAQPESESKCVPSLSEPLSVDVTPSEAQERETVASTETTAASRGRQASPVNGSPPDDDEDDIFKNFMPKKSCLKKLLIDTSSIMSQESDLTYSTSNATSSPLFPTTPTSPPCSSPSSSPSLSSSSLLSPNHTTNSANSSKKRVSFADVAGKDLYTIRTMSEPSNCPPKLTSKIVQYFLNREFNSNNGTYNTGSNSNLSNLLGLNGSSSNGGSSSRLNSYDYFFPPTNRDFFSTSRNYDYGIAASNYTNDLNQLAGSIAVYSLNFAQPASDYLKFRQRINDKCVSLENVILNRFQINGTIKVKNITFHKCVFVRCSFDTWNTYQDFPAQYVPSEYFTSQSLLSSPTSSSMSATFYGSHNVNYQPHHREFDTFRFEFQLPKTADNNKTSNQSSSSPSSKNQPNASIQFCICYRTGQHSDQREYWDNNDAKNYEILQYVIDIESLKPQQSKSTGAINNNNSNNNAYNAKTKNYKYENQSNSSLKLNPASSLISAENEGIYY